MNDSKENLVFDSNQFDYGRWYTTPKTVLLPGEMTYMEMANDDGLMSLSGLAGRIRYKSISTVVDIYFSNPQFGRKSAKTVVSSINGSSPDIIGDRVQEISDAERDA